MTMPGPTSNSFISQRLRLHYVDWGNPDAPPLILQHGGRDHCRSWDWVAQDLARDWHVIAPDLRGHGDSAWTPDGNYEMNAFVYDFAQLVHTLGYDQVTIVAHSLGGNISSRFTGLSPMISSAPISESQRSASAASCGVMSFAVLSMSGTGGLVQAWPPTIKTPQTRR